METETQDIETNIFNTKLKKLTKLNEIKESEGRFQDFCSQFKFDLSADNEEFNERFNYGTNWKILLIDKTASFFADIGYAIKIVSNIIIFIYGPRNMSKSEVAQRIMMEYQDMFYYYKKREVDKYYGFSDGEMAKIFPQMKEGEIATRDESPNNSGEGTNTIKKNLENICNITRGYQVSFIFINPYPIKQEGIDYYLEVAGKDLENRLTRCLLYDRRHILRGVVYIKLHDDEDYRKEYKRRKKANIKRIMANAGGTYVGVDIDKLERDAIKLYEFCYKRNATTKINIETYLANYNKQFKERESNKKILGTNSYIRKLIQNVFNALNGMSSILDEYLENKDLEELAEEVDELSHKKQIEKQSHEIDFHETLSFPDFCYRNIPDEKVARIGMSLARGDSLRTINDNYNDLNYNYIRETSTLLRTEGYEYRLGYLFEKWFGLTLGIPIDQLDDYVAGVEHVPDLIWNGEIYSLKFRYNSLSNTLKFSQSNTLEHNFNQEYKEAKRQGKTYKAVILNPKWGPDLVIQDIDPIKDPDIIKIKKPTYRKRLVLS